MLFILVLRKCPFCMLDQPVEKSNIMEVQGELHPMNPPPNWRNILKQNKQITQTTVILGWFWRHEISIDSIQFRDENGLFGNLSWVLSIWWSERERGGGEAEDKVLRKKERGIRQVNMERDSEALSSSLERDMLPLYELIIILNKS